MNIFNTKPGLGNLGNFGIGFRFDYGCGGHGHGFGDGFGYTDGYRINSGIGEGKCAQNGRVNFGSEGGFGVADLYGPGTGAGHGNGSGFGSGYVTGEGDGGGRPKTIYIR